MKNREDLKKKEKDLLRKKDCDQKRKEMINYVYYVNRSKIDLMNQRGKGENEKKRSDLKDLNYKKKWRKE